MATKISGVIQGLILLHFLPLILNNPLVFLVVIVRLLVI